LRGDEEDDDAKITPLEAKEIAKSIEFESIKFNKLIAESKDRVF
jgi:hypothetical protein